MPKIKKLTRKQAGFVRDYVETENGVQAALKNYDTKEYFTASSIAVENLEKPLIIEAVKREQQKYADRFSDDLLEKKHKELLNKKEVAVRTNKFGNVEIIPTGEIDANAVKSGLEMAYRIKGHFVDNTTNNTLNVFNLSDLLKKSEELPKLASEQSTQIQETVKKDEEKQS